MKIPTSLSPFRLRCCVRALLAVMAALSYGVPSAAAQTAPTFTNIIVFGDSLSDNGNLRKRMEDRGVNYPGGGYNYSDGRFTNSSDTDP